jgi:Ca2+/Na+ antiporter
MSPALSISLFILSAIFVIVLSIIISYLADIIENKIKKSSAIISGILLSFITTIPELVMCFVAIFTPGFVNPAEYVLGDILGGNFINIVALALVSLFFIKHIRHLTPCKTE